MTSNIQNGGFINKGIKNFQVNDGFGSNVNVVEVERLNEKNEELRKEKKSKIKIKKEKCELIKQNNILN